MALKSLIWLRGCVWSEAVVNEYDSLQEYNDRLQACYDCKKQSLECSHAPSLGDKVKQLKRKRILKPLILIVTLQFFLQFCAINSWFPYIIQILKAYSIQWDAYLTVIAMCLLGFSGRICLLPLLKKIGKRNTYLASSAVTFLCCFGLSN